MIKDNEVRRYRLPDGTFLTKEEVRKFCESHLTPEEIRDAEEMAKQLVAGIPGLDKGDNRHG